MYGLPQRQLPGSEVIILECVLAHDDTISFFEAFLSPFLAPS